MGRCFVFFHFLVPCFEQNTDACEIFLDSGHVPMMCKEICFQSRTTFFSISSSMFLCIELVEMTKCI